MANEPPDWIVPMAATLTQERFAEPGWIFERKFDGIRLLAWKRGSDVCLYSRNHLLQDLPAIAAAVAALPVMDAVLDGEVTWDGSTYHVFDVMWLGGRETMTLALHERRALLRTLPLVAPLLPVDELAIDGELTPYDHAARQGWEGVIAKRRDSLYEQRRSPHWVKMKCEVTQEFVVGGFTDPQGKRVGLGALLVGTYRQDDFVFAGKVSASFDIQKLKDLRARFDAIETSLSPFTVGTAFPRTGVHWVRPAVVVQVAFIEWTRHGKLRHPRVLDVR